MRGRAVMLVGLCGVGLALTGCGRAEAPNPPSTVFAQEPAPEGAVYRAFYRGGVEGFVASRVRWLDDGDGFELTITGSGDCPVAPVALEVLASDRLRVEAERRSDPEGCQEDAALWSYVLDVPDGLDATLPVHVEIVDELGTTVEELAPRGVPTDHLEG